MLSKNDSDVPVNLTFHIKEWGRIDSPFTSYYGRVYGVKVGEWWDEFGERLLQDNIRNMLGNTEVNSQIAETAEHNPELFWYFNNGITILAESVEKSAENRSNRDFGFFKASGASVVNGAQTVSVLGNLYKNGVDLSSLEIPLRVIELKPGSGEIRKDITRTNNTQNTILSKDFIAQDPVQESLRKQVFLLGWEYQVKRDAEFSGGEKRFDLDEAIEALVMISGQSNYAATFRKEIGRFYVMDRDPYKSLFNPSVSGYKLINAVAFRRAVHSAVEILMNAMPGEERASRKAQVLTNGAVLVGQLAVAEVDLAVNIDSEVKELDLAEITEVVGSAANRVFEYCEDKYKNMYLRPLFQNAAKCEALYRNCIDSGKVDPKER